MGWVSVTSRSICHYTYAFLFKFNRMNTANACELCQRANMKLTFHHLIPRKMHSKKYVQKVHPNIELNTHGISLCIPCHKQLHKLFTHRELALEYYSAERIKASERMKAAIKFNAKQKKLKKPL